MDTIIQKKRFPSKRLIMIASAVVAVVAMAMLSSSFGLFSYSISKQKLIIKDVDFGVFEDFISASATVEPINTVLVNVIEGGMVQEILCEDGAMVEKGQQLARIVNPNVSLNYMTQETSIVEQMNNLRNTQLIIENTQRDLNDKLFLQEKEYFEAERQYKMDTMLYRKGVIARNEYLKTVENYNYQQKRTKLIRNGVEKEIVNRESQLERVKTSITLMERNLEILRENRSNFIVKAPIAGRLSSFNPVLGQNFQSGQSMGKIDVLSGFMVRSTINEYYLSKVKEGMQAHIIVQGERFALIVSKVIPEVVNGQFQVDFTFVDQQPENITRGQAIQIRIELSDKAEVVRLPKGAFNDATGGKWIFVVDGNRAYRREIQLGRSNPSYYEVIDGLQKGEKVIVSSYSSFKDKDEIVIEN
ncbi:MAG: efflux RND transporter periplasmic adaptor subunit [Bacteroidales bacterium]|nr:efflux RND transporter periplasmic adaptor subunit [Bacteroidales bacterium]